MRQSMATDVPRLHFNSHFPDGPELSDTRIAPFWILLEQG